MGVALWQGAEAALGRALVTGQVKAPGGGWGWAGRQVRGLEWREELPGGPEAWGKGQDRMPGWDGETEVAQGWGRAEPLNGGAEGPERGPGREGCAGLVLAVPRRQAEGRRGKGVGGEPAPEPGVGRGSDAGVEGAAGGAGAQMPLLGDGAGAQPWGLENLGESQEESGAGQGQLRGVAWPLP